MRKLLPTTPPLKRISRKAIDILSALAVTVTVISLFAVTYLTNTQDEQTVDVSSYAIYKGNAENGAAGMMFNVYEGSDIIMEILSILQSYSVKSTFFIGGVWAEKNADTLLAIAENGHEIGCHGYLHKDHATLSLEQNKEEIVKTNRLIKEITGKNVTLFAPPSGSFGKNTEDACRALGQKMILWTKDTIDWRDNDPSLLIKRATKNPTSGDLVLMHPKKQTLSALPTIIETYLDKGISLNTVSEVIK